MRRARKAKADGASRLPPYHPDYQAGAADEDAALSAGSASDDYYAEPASVALTAGRLRRGSEGYEVRPINREEMLTRYIQEQVGEVGRYNVYVPEPDVDSESYGSGEDEEAPLASRVKNWRAATEETRATDL